MKPSPLRLRTQAWRMIGLTRSERGVLSLAHDRLTFTTHEGVVFDVPVAEVSEATAPWYYFGGGIKLRVRAERYRFSFVRPNDDLAVYDDLEPIGVEDAPGLFAGSDIARGRRACRAWQAALGA
jgi:hypothetical protein